MPKIILPTQDLFPETLLVTQQQGHVFTDSLKIAEHFGKRHDHVVRTIASLTTLLNVPNFGDINQSNESNVELINDFSRLNFQPRNYTDSRGRQKPMYHLTKDGFALLAMGFTGAKALYWKVQFINAFNAMESQLRAQEQRYLTALDAIRPSLRPVVEGTQHGLVRSHIAEQIGKSPAAVTYHRRVAKKLGLLVA
jgi:Rha family phage regulatory protein